MNTRTATTPADLAAYLGTDNKTAGTILGRLLDGGYIAKPHRGTYAQVRIESVESEESTGQPPLPLAADSPLSTVSTHE